jgi:hypothetical protein
MFYSTDLQELTKILIRLAYPAKHSSLFRNDVGEDKKEKVLKSFHLVSKNLTLRNDFSNLRRML